MSTLALISLIVSILGGVNNALNIAKTVGLTPPQVSALPDLLGRAQELSIIHTHAVLDGRTTLTPEEVAQVARHQAAVDDYFNGPLYQN